MKITKIALAALALTFTASGGYTLESPAQAQNAQASSQLPAELRKAAIATLFEEDTGQIAGAQINNTPYYIVYMKTRYNCGTGGCRAQIWKKEGNRFIEKEALTVGFLPIVLLPHVDNGMQRIGVSSESDDGRLAILPIAFDGQNYATDLPNNLVTPTSGKPIVTTEMLNPL